MIIGGLQKTTLIDYPGKVACTVFLSGCNFRCPWCYSPELVLPEFISGHPRISEKKVLSFLRQRKGLLEGVVICGGEPTLNADLPEFLAKIKSMDFAVKIDSNGSNSGMMERLIADNLADYIAMDIKAPLEDSSYGAGAGIKVDLDEIKKSIKIIKESGIDYEFRTTVVPGFHKKEDIIRIAEYISPAKKYCLQSFRKDKVLDQELKGSKPYPKEFFNDIKKQIGGKFNRFELRI